MSKKDYKKGMSDAVEAYEGFGKKQEAAIEHVAGEVAKAAGKMDKLGDKIGEIKDYITDQEKAALYKLNTPVDIAALGNNEKRILLAVLYQLSADEEELTEEQQGYVRAVQQYLKIYNPQTEIDMGAVENIKDIAAQKAVLQTVLEFFYLGAHPGTYSEDQLEFLDCFQVNRKTRREISDHIKAIVETVGVQGLAEKYGFVPQDDYMGNPTYSDNGPVSLVAADQCAQMQGNLFAITDDYICFHRNYSENPGFYCINKQTGEEVYVKFEKSEDCFCLWTPCAKGNIIYFIELKGTPGTAGFKKSRTSVKCLDIATRAVVELPQKYDQDLDFRISETGDWLSIYSQYHAWWIDLKHGNKVFEVSADVEIQDAIACEGRILLVEKQDDDASGLATFYWYDPVKNTTELALKEAKPFGCSDYARIKAIRRIRDDLLILFGGSDNQYSVCRWAFTEKDGKFEILDETEAPSNDVPYLFGEACILKFIGAEGEFDHIYLAAAFLDEGTFEWKEIPHSEADSYALYGDYLYKDGESRTKLNSDYRWEIIE